MSNTAPSAPRTLSTAPLSALPSVDRLLGRETALVLAEHHGRDVVKAAIQSQLDQIRGVLRSDASAAAPTADAILSAVTDRLAHDAELPLRPVFNLTGTVLHTNLGRASLPREALDAVAAVAAGASNLEFDLETGKRGDRDTHLEAEICRITGAEAATVVNNNAAAVILVLNTLALGRDVPVSRGELVEIGGSFRIPDIMSRAGCRLVEVGTTNRTHLKDFAAAIGAETALVMKVHTSNYVIEGFTKVVPEPEIAALCKTRGIPFVNDLGSGTLVDLERWGLPHEPTPMDALAAGADVVTFSGDKLLGGPQAGLIVGRKDLIARMKANPLKRALRCDKMTIAALAAVLRLYRAPDKLAERLPTLTALTRDQQDIAAAAERMLPALTAAIAPHATAAIVACESQIGSGALPTRTVPSAGFAITPVPDASITVEAIAAAFRALPIPVVGRISKGAFHLDLRCLAQTAEADFAAGLNALRLAP
jgi:L-seryl-tRNA(Ser) seleniumtransferase